MNNIKCSNIRLNIDARHLSAARSGGALINNRISSVTNDAVAGLVQNIPGAATKRLLWYSCLNRWMMKR